MAKQVYDPDSDFYDDYNREREKLRGEIKDGSFDPDDPDSGSDIDTNVSPEEYDEFRQEAARFKDRLDKGQGINIGTPGKDEGRTLYRDTQAKKDKDDKNKKGGWLKKKSVSILAGSTLSGIGGLLISLVMMISPLKLEMLFNSVDASAFVRYNALFDRRSSKFLDAYIKARLFEIDSGDPRKGNMLFRSNRVDTNSPFTDWYRTMRTSSFERDLFDKYGIKFYAITDTDTATGAIRGINGAKITFKNQEVDFDLASLLREAEIDPDSFEDAIKSGQADNFLNSLPEAQQRQLFDIDIFPDDASARKAIRAAVNDEIPLHRFLKRRNLRSNIRNMTGVREWRFFEKTRGKIENRKVRFQNELLKRTFALTNGNGKFFACLFGGPCPNSADPSNPENNSNGRPDTDIDRDEPDTSGTTPEEDADLDNRIKTDDELGRASTAAEEATEELGAKLLEIKEGDKLGTRAIKKLLTSNVIKKITGGFAIIQFMDSIVLLHNTFKSGKLLRMVSMMRLASYVAVFTAFQTLKDQINAADAPSEDIATAFEAFDSVELSEAYNYIVNKKAVSESAKKTMCRPELEEKRMQALENRDKANMQIEPICPEDQIGSTAATGLKIIDGYNRTIGEVIDPLAKAYSAPRNLPILGDIIDAVGAGLDWVASTVQEAVLNPLLEVTGLSPDKLIEWVMEQVGGFFGLGPVADGSYSPGDFNAAFVGAVGASESAMRNAGAMITDAVLQEDMDRVVAQYQEEQHESLSTWDRYFAKENPNSLLSRVALAMPKSMGDVFDGFLHQPQTIANSITNPIYAQEAIPRPGELAGMQEYDFPISAIESDPTSRAVNECTNANSILAKDVKLTWEVAQDSLKFWDTVHAAAKDQFDEAEYDTEVGKIWNICIADAQVANAMKTKYTSEDDGGLEGETSAPEAGDPGTATANPGGSGVVGDPYTESESVACAPGTNDLGVHDGYASGKLVKHRLCALTNLTSGSSESTPGSQYYIDGASGRAIVNSRMSGAWFALINEAKSAGINLSASSSFRTNAHQTDLCNADSGCRNGDTTFVASPGGSSHQAGTAIDFANMGGKGGKTCASRATNSGAGYKWLVANAGKYGLKQYSAEAWHWDALPAANRC